MELEKDQFNNRKENMFTGFLDKLSPAARHFVLMLVASAITIGLQNQDVILGNLPASVAPIVGALVTIFATAVTPFTQQYGVASSDTTVSIDSGDTDN